LVCYSVTTTNYTMLQVFNFFWGIAQLVPFFLGMRLLLVTRLSNNFGFTKELSSFNKVWWGVAASYLAIIFVCCLTNMCMNPGGDDMFSWYYSSGARLVLTKIFQCSAFLINLLGIILVCMGIHWYNKHRRTRMIAKGGCFAGLYVYYVVW